MGRRDGSSVLARIAVCDRRGGESVQEWVAQTKIRAPGTRPREPMETRRSKSTRRQPQADARG